MITQLWPQSENTGNVRRRLRRELLVTHHGVRAYALQQAEETGEEIRTTIAERLQVDPDPRPRVYASSGQPSTDGCNRPGTGPDPTATIDELIRTLREYRGPRTWPHPGFNGNNRSGLNRARSLARTGRDVVARSRRHPLVVPR